ncbi:MAG: hypothetical protein HeimC3_50040 [Candidatus Heimdallarchaeota archaeon LC_3]|nr:MAG: hypothetical protein HeimC3_50040 [Candidatus Heimdallarchaeota archaeon LC_3]
MATNTGPKRFSLIPSNYKIFDHLVIDVINQEKKLTDLEIKNALIDIKRIFSYETIPNYEILEVKSLAKTIAFLKRNSRLKSKYEKFLIDFEKFKINFKPYFNLVFQSLFDDNINISVMNSDQVLSSILKTNNIDLVNSHKVVITEIFQLLRDFLQFTFLYVAQHDEKAALAYLKFKLNQKAEGKSIREISFHLEELWELLSKLDYVLRDLFKIKIIQQPEDDIYNKHRNSKTHLNIIPKGNRTNTSILEEEVEFISRSPNKFLKDSIPKINIIPSNYEKLEQELLCWTGFIIQTLSIFAFMNHKFDKQQSDNV